jgi:hypothetical protein
MANQTPHFTTRPANRKGTHRRPPTARPSFDRLLKELATARIRVEDLRAHNAAVSDRFEARVALDALRLEMARSRRSLV